MSKFQLFLLSFIASYCLVWSANAQIARPVNVVKQIQKSQEDDKNEGNFEGWSKLHGLYMEALKLRQDVPDHDMTEADFTRIKQDGELRQNYLELMASTEEFCVQNKSKKACANLLKGLEKNTLQDCIGDVESALPSEKVVGLSENIEQIILASTKNEFAAYSNSKGVANMIARLRSNLTKKCTASSCSGKRRPGSVAQCWRFVKHGLMGGGYTKSYPGSANARDAGGDLRKMGFKNLLSDPKYKSMNGRTAPKGAVLVYTGGCCGHVEVKAGDGSYLSDFDGRRPVNESIPRRLIGIYVK
jgi:hypothetical protein